MTLPRKFNDRYQERCPFSLEVGTQAMAPATGTIACASNASAADGDSVTIGDGMNPAVVYEYDKSSNGVSVGHVTWAVGTTAASNSTALAALIATNQPGLTVVDDLAGNLTLTHKWPGAGGNVTITKSGAVVSAVTGMAGGASATAIAATTTLKARKFEDRAFRVEHATWLPYGTMTQDAANYWTIALKNGSTVVASWSTLTGSEGTLTGGTHAEMTLSATDANLVFAAADIATLVLTKTGSPAPLPAGLLTVHGRYV